MSTVEFRGIVKRYGAVAVLDRLSLKVDSGEFLVLLGPSGCGKTTLLNLLAGLLDPTDGEIFIGDREVTDLDPKDRGLAMVFQSYALYPTKTVRGNLKFGLSSRRLSATEIDRRIAWVSKLLKIDHLLDRKPAQLSGGQRQRVAIGRALVKQVELCLFDEPLSNLDAKLRAEMRVEIKRLHSEIRNTVLYVTHDQTEAMTMATKIAIMDKGVIQQVGSPDDIYDRPANIFVADFVGSPRMNMLGCRVSKTSNGIAAVHRSSALELNLGGYPWSSDVSDGQAIYLGFRPEHLVPRGPVPADNAIHLEATVEFLERPGAELVAFLSLGEETIIARVQPETAAAYRQAARVPLLVPQDKINVFDAESGRRM